MDMRLKLRVFSCIETVLDVHDLFESNAFNNDLMTEIKTAKEKLLQIPNFDVNEEQVENIEVATNHLLGMISDLSSDKILNKIYRGYLH